MAISVEEWIFVKRYLMDEKGFNEDHAESAANRLMRDPGIFRDFMKYIETQNIPFTMENGIRVENRVHGYTISELMQVYGLSTVGAYLMLSEIHHDKEKAEQHLEDILTYGHEKPVFGSDGKLMRIEFIKPSPPKCDECGEPATWIKEYNRWYCHNCSKYLE